MIVLIDNYDSFAHNLARYFRQLGQQVCVFRNDELDLPQLQALSPAAVVISPGPCTPNESGICLELTQQLAGRIPIMGICLGHQVICQALGGTIVRSPAIHGRVYQVFHNHHVLFESISSPFNACRYHSLVAHQQSLPGDLQVLATTEQGLVMAVAHQSHRIFGVQFHPESILTQQGYTLISNFLAWSNISVDDGRARELDLLLEQQQLLVRDGERSIMTPHG